MSRHLKYAICLIEILPKAAVQLDWTGVRHRKSLRGVIIVITLAVDLL